ncbi:nucleotidyl transferase AbiEii/AbiGii toxin family protein [Syntrophobacter fumaroxidans]|uniref:Nucleotidyl transferase AbiEii/AbiGii toxin family protein n=1 Tax=Syntrophobacter fumaroxidans (strain DSM 10017 / MPOB) TaxID=335543 RepID=A0LER7_SYNFM|nr:nucleotidyl transferase AbiEii/AbiGii toxin family protein [Syntrophobacter fumaroxidans]ABK15919.1 conserved hypothetical protein [Syntrophobacter fumaroxidans MPOB]
MERFYGISAEKQRKFCEEAKSIVGYPPITIEKDFWVCFILRELFGLQNWGQHLAFKGGTSLSKGWQLISRFSEDVDVVIRRGFLGFPDDHLGSKRREKLRKECGRRIQEDLKPTFESRLREVLPDDLEWSLTLEDAIGDPDRSMFFQYPTIFKTEISYLKRIVKVELGARSETEPIEDRPIQSYLAEAFPNIFGNSTFFIRTVTARRTFWEKAMLLHEETFRPTDKPRKGRLSRHYYDLWCMINKSIGKEALADVELFDRVAQHRKIFFRQSWVNYETLKKGSLRLVPPPEQMAEWRKDYEAMREDMFFDDPPPFDQLLEVILAFEEEFNR